MIRLLLILLAIGLIFGCDQIGDQISKHTDRKFKEIEENHQEEITSTKSQSIEIIQNNSDIEQLKEIHKLTMGFEKYIKKFRSDLTNHLARVQKSEKSSSNNFRRQMEFTIGKNQQGEAYMLEKKLRSYIENINVISDSFNFEHIAKHGNEMSMQKDRGLADKDFATWNFNYSSNAAVFSTLTYYHLKVAKVELAALKIILE